MGEVGKSRYLQILFLFPANLQVFLSIFDYSDRFLIPE